VPGVLTLPARAGRRCHNAVNPLHSATYFAPELTQEFAKAGVNDWHAAYFASRSAAMGSVDAATVTATFNTYKGDLIAQHIPQVWSVVSPQEAIAARLHAADALLRRLLGEEAIACKEMAEAAELALRATEACAPSGRPLSAAHRALPVPDAPHLALWHAASVLREHRGDCHIAVLVNAELDGLEAQVTHTSSGKGITPAWVARTRGWTPEEWSAAQDRLCGRGLLDAEGGLTAPGMKLREELESETDLLARAPYEHLGAAGVERLTELATGFTRTALGAGAFPPDLFGKS
jgi:hypothetical protein